jgi:hypothetical protein
MADDPARVVSPGHGNLYAALATGGALGQLLAQGYESTPASQRRQPRFLVIDPAILGYFAEQRHAFMMEVTDRTEADKRAGTWRAAPRADARAPRVGNVRRRRRRLQDVTRHRYLIWLSLPRLKAFLDEQGIVRSQHQTIDPRDVVAGRVSARNRDGGRDRARRAPPSACRSSARR